MRRGFLIVLLLAIAPTAAEAQTPPAKAVVAERVEAVVRERLAHPQGPASISVAIVRNGETLVQRAWGLADAGRKIPATDAMTYRIASVSKQFTAALILKLVDRGRIALADPLSRHLTLPSPAWRAIKIEHLLNHTAGLQRDYRPGALLALGLGPQTGAAMLAAAGRDPLLYPPGTKHLYSNTGYMVLGAVVEKLYGKRFAEVIRDEIARPLGLATLVSCSESERSATQTRGHVRSAQGVLETAAEVGDIALGGSGLCLTAADMARWNLALHRGRVLSPASYRAMITPRGAAVAESYGFGLRSLRTPSGAPVITHDGGTFTYSAENAYYPADNLSVTVFYNSTPPQGTGPLAALFANIATGRSAIDAAPPAAATGLGAFAGFYEGRPGRGFLVTLEKDALFVTPTDGSKQPLALKSGAIYAVGKMDVTMTFTRDAAGRVVSLTLREGARERIFSKVR